MLPKHLNLRPILMWSIAALFYFYENSLQVSQSVMVDVLLRDLHTHAGALSFLASCYFFGYALIQVPVGLIIDQYGVRTPLFLAVLSCALGAMLFAHAHDIYVAGFAKFVIGIGSAFAALSALQIAALHFSKARFASLTGLLLTIGMCGQIFGESPLQYLIQQFSWRHTMMILGYGGLGIVLMVLLFMPSRQAKAHAAQSFQTITSQLKTVMGQPQPWLVGTYGMFMFTPFLILTGTWGVPFLIYGCHYNAQDAANLIALLPLGFAIGAPVIGYLSDRFFTRRKPMAWSAVTQSALLVILFAAPSMSKLEHALLFGTLGFVCSGFLPAFSMMKEITSEKVRSASLGFMNTFNMAGVILFMPMVGLILERHWQHQMQHGYPVYSLHNFQISLAILPIMTLVAWSLIYWIRESLHQH